jgi:GntP family gluconate:H+ symporter
MNVSFLQIILFLIAGIVAIILLTVKFKIHPFFALLIACFVTGIGVEIPVDTILQYIKTGFGDMIGRLSVIIVLGTTIGVLLEKNGSTQVMANAILKMVGPKRSSLALSITGFIVGLPIFCDSGYIVLNGINKSLVKRSGVTIATMSISLASGLYAVHCLLPPHPGATVAASALRLDIGLVILCGFFIAIPAMLVGHWWAVYAGRNTPAAFGTDDEEKEVNNDRNRPDVFLAFLPVVVPIILMAIRSVIGLETGVRDSVISQIFFLMGDPAIALAVGVILALATGRYKKGELSQHLSSAVEKAGGILVIIGAGGAFGTVLAATDIGTHFSKLLDLKTAGIWFPFLLTTILKTAQGSSTVAIITASSIIVPLLSSLGLDSDNGALLTALAMGAGSIMISHTNDAYFWVISRFSSIDIRTMLRVHSVASVLMGLVTMIIVYILSVIIL